jgi:hypothetical protein
MTSDRDGERWLCAAVAALALYFWSAAGSCQQGPQISITPAVVETGYIDSLVIASTGGFDLSKVDQAHVTISPDNDIREVRVRSATQTSLVLSVYLSSNAELGSRTLTVRAGDIAATGTFTVTQGPAITVARLGHNTSNSWVVATVEVRARGGVNLSKVEFGDVDTDRSDQVTVMEVTHQTQDSLTVGFLFDPSVDRNVVRYLTILRDINLTAEFALAEPDGPRICKRLEHCCQMQSGSPCSLCLPIDQLCQP